jgi:two-component system, OmpR family, sensor kinase
MVPQFAHPRGPVTVPGVASLPAMHGGRSGRDEAPRPMSGASPIHSLYWRIFLAFWLALALILVGTVTVAVNVSAQQQPESPWVQRGQLFAQAARAFEADGPNGLKSWLESLKASEPFNRTFVVEPSGKEMLGRPLPAFLRGPGVKADSGGAGSAGPISPVGGMLVLVGSRGAAYHVLVGPLRKSPRLFGELENPGVPGATLILALVVSAVVCFLLARYLVAPVERMRRAMRRMAAGDLDVRVSQSMRGRQDDLGLLAADLDTMVERVRTLLETKQQLLRDVSHELRSPLARLQLALSLARRQDSVAERHLARIACEADRLEQLIARTLTLARLERPASSIERTRIDIGDLLKNIADDVAIEADAHGCTVSLQSAGGLEVSGDLELLRSSFENVIRNAVRYSPVGAQVGIAARCMHSAAHANYVEVTVHDRGPGVPDKDIELIFEPFYRVDAARDRAGGGEGLGLAIAARAVALHNGTIQAQNSPGGGLVVSVVLPALEHESAPVATSSSATAA